MPLWMTPLKVDGTNPYDKTRLCFVVPLPAYPLNVPSKLNPSFLLDVLAKLLPADPRFFPDVPI